MLAVKRALYRLGERAGAPVVCEHRRPRDGLQHCPMRSRRREQRDDQKNVAEPLEHIAKLNCADKIASRIHVSEIHTSVPPGSKSKSGIKSASARWMQPKDVGWLMDF